MNKHEICLLLHDVFMIDIRKRFLYTLINRNKIPQSSNTTTALRCLHRWRVSMAAKTRQQKVARDEKSGVPLISRFTVVPRDWCDELIVNPIIFYR